MQGQDCGDGESTAVELHDAEEHLNEVAPGLPVDDGNGQEDAKKAAQDHREAARTDREER